MLYAGIGALFIFYETPMKKITLLLATLLISTFAMADEAVVIKLSSGAKEDSSRGQAAAKFKLLAEKYTNGRVQVEVTPYTATAATGQDLVDLRSNKVQMAVPEISRLDEVYGVSDANPYHVMEMPFLFADMASVHKFLAGPVAGEMASTLNGLNVKLVGVWDNGFKLVSTNKSIGKENDLKGQTFGVAPSSATRSQFRMWGAKPREVSLDGLASALTYNTVDGSESTAPDFVAGKLYNVQKYLYLTKHSYEGYAWLVNRTFWSALPADVRTQLDRAVAETTTFERAIAITANNTAIQEIKATGLTRVLALSPEVQTTLKNMGNKVEGVLSASQKQVLSKVRGESK
jgi:C4-dicarboxylate-binding protein DctP